MARTITFMGELGCGNFGADASFFTMADSVHRAIPNSTIVCACWDPQLIPERFRADAVPLHRRSSTSLLHRLWGRARDPFDYFRLVRRSDLVAVAGGGMLESGLGVTPSGRPLRLLMFAIACLVTGTPFAFVDVGATDMPTTLTAAMMGFSAARSRYRSFRDAGSRAAVGRMRVDTRSDPVFADVVFALEPPAEPAIRHERARPLLAFGILAHAREPADPAERTRVRDRYLETMTQTTLALVRSGVDVLLTPGDELDLPIARSIRDALSTSDAGPHVSVSEVHSYEELVSVLATADVVLASRYHALVGAIAAGRATGALAYSDKFDSLLQRAGMPPAIDIEAVQPDAVVALCSRLLTDRRELERSADRSRSALQALAVTQLDALADLVTSGSGAHPGLRRSDRQEVADHGAPAGQDPA